jgi:hypothetical protein
VIRIGEGSTAADRDEARVANSREDHTQHPFCSHLLNGWLRYQLSLSRLHRRVERMLMP